MNRRSFLATSIATALGLSACGRNPNSISNSPVTLPLAFSNKLVIPPELIGTNVGGRKQFNLNIQQGTSRFLDNLDTSTWGINGAYLGPTIRLTNGDSVDLKFTNNLTESTTMHGHGMHVPAAMDGGVHQIIAANGGTWTSSYTVNQHACTNWYHPHLMGKTAEHVIKGLTGLIIIDDNDSAALDLPKTYGIDDIPLVVQDKSFNNDGSFDYDPTMRETMHGWKGDIMMMNGVIKPYIDVENKQIRFRILNGSNARIYKFAFKSGKTFTQIATDNAFLESPVPLTELTLSPAERAEIVVDFTNNLGTNDIFYNINDGSELLKININTAATATTTVPSNLLTLASLNVADAVKTRVFTLSGGMGVLQINGKSMDKARIDERVPVNAVEIWDVKNNMGMNHNFHIHATHFQLIERNGSALNVANNEKGFKDTVLVPPNESVKFIVKMTDYTDTSTPYMYHCHILEHEDLGMMGQFTVE